MEKNKIIHLYITEKCTHRCKLCCNKQYNMEKVPIVTIEELKNAETICLTGGEPFIISDICNFAKSIKIQYPNIKQIYVYTCGDSLLEWLNFFEEFCGIDGITIAPKNKYDVLCLHRLINTNKFIKQILSLPSNRIYLFPEVRKIINHIKLNIDILSEYKNIEIINREWKEDFTEDSGLFRRIPILF